eukprot:scaffold77701_cov49-Attheya_sp.AAC.4
MNLIERKGCHVLFLIFGISLLFVLRNDTMELGTAHEIDIIAQIELAVPVGHRCGLHAFRVVLVKEGVGEIKVLAVLLDLRAQNLLREVLIDHGGLQTQALGRVDALRIVIGLDGRGRVVGRLVDREVVKLSRIALVEEEGAPRQLLHHNVPGIDRPGAGHEVGQNGVRGKDIRHAIDCQLLDDGVVRGGDWVELLGLVAPEGRRGPGRHLVVAVVVLVHKSAPEQGVGCVLAGRARGRDLVGDEGLGELAKVVLVHANPVGLDADRGLAVHALLPAAPAASSTPAPAAASSAAREVVAVALGALRHVVAPLVGIQLGHAPGAARIQLPQARLMLPPLGRRVHEPRLLTRGLLARVHQLEGAHLLGVHLVLEVRVLARVISEPPPILPLVASVVAGLRKVRRSAQSVRPTERRVGK